MYKPTLKDRELAHHILKEELDRVQLTLNNEDMEDKIQVVLSIAYTFDKDYKEETIRKIVRKVIVENDVI